MKVKTLVCNCKGWEPSSGGAVNAVRFVVESAIDGSQTELQFSLEEGTEILQDVLRAAEDDSDTYVVMRAGVDESPADYFRPFCSKSRPEGGKVQSPDSCYVESDGILARISVRLAELADHRLHH